MPGSLNHRQDWLLHYPARRSIWQPGTGRTVRHHVGADCIDDPSATARLQQSGDAAGYIDVAARRLL
ncbi:hypothetical protein DM806_09430 [Sphingobium lactosutens]|nr:hypothetical protein [Sphingobium lactosutens]